MIVAYSARTGERLWRWSNRRMVVNDIAADPSRARCTITGGNLRTGGQLFLTSALDGPRENGYGGRASTPLERAARTTSRSHPTVGRSTSRARYAARTRGCTGSSSPTRDRPAPADTGTWSRAYRQVALVISPDARRSPVWPAWSTSRRLHAAAGASRHRTAPVGVRRCLGRPAIAASSFSRSARSSVFVEWEDRDPTLASLDPSDGTVIWSHDLPRLRLVSTLAATPSVLVVEGGIRRLGTVAAFDSDDGTRAWSTELRRAMPTGSTPARAA